MNVRLIGAGKTAKLLKVVAHCLRAKIVPLNGGLNEQDILEILRRRRNRRLCHDVEDCSRSQVPIDRSQYY